MSFLTNLSKTLFNRQGNTRALFLARSLQQEISDTNFNEEDWVDQDPKDRSLKIDVDTSIRYLNSEAYKKAYGDSLIWTLYRRNKTCHYLGETRKTCIRKDMISTASPCPICRDMYLVLHHRNLKLLEQFISPYSGEILPSKKTGLCQKQQENLIIAIMRAKDYGLLPHFVPFMHYDYKYYKELSVKFVEEYKSRQKI